MRLRDLTLLGAERYSDLALLLLRVATGAFLLYQSHDNLLDPARMAEFEKFMAHFGFWRPALLAPLTIALQVAAGLAFILGLFVRPFGLLIAGMFVVAVYKVHMADPANLIWSAASLIFIGLYLGTRGGGAFALDRLIAGTSGGRRRR